MKRKVEDKAAARTSVLFPGILLLLILAFSFTAFALEARSVHIKILLNPQYGTGGTSEFYIAYDSPFPPVDPPSRRGYEFQGYWSEASGRGTQYYDAAGKPLVTACSFTADSALYAFWTPRTYPITYQNMTDAVSGVNAPSTHTYGRNTKISDPVREGYTFFGWQVDGSLVAARSLVLGAVAYDDSITLTAVWNKAALVTLVANTAESVTMNSEDLRQVFERQTDDPERGVTAEDLNSDKVQLTLYASDADHQSEGAADIIGVAQGEVLKFYDFTVTKTVTKTPESVPVESSLRELPNTVQIEIALAPELRGRSSYRVYRYHDGYANPLPAGTGADPDRLNESFQLSSDGNTLTIHTRRLSTYAVVGGERIMSGTGMVEQDTIGMDVQALIAEGGDGPVYKVDIVWGAMRFSYTTGKTWDPDEHRYTDIRIYDWIPEVCYSNGNNEVTVYNHSNADVSVSFLVSPRLKTGADISLLEGVDMVINQTNEPEGAPAQDVLLSKVPVEGADAPAVSGYLRLNGSPVNPEFYKNLETDAEGYVKVADIAVTITHLDGVRTPRADGLQ